jgi:hypothetical protein
MVRLHTLRLSLSGNFFFLFILRFPDAGCSSALSQVGARGRKSLQNTTEEEIDETPLDASNFKRWCVAEPYIIEVIIYNLH